jgi:hypothetical protein
MWGREGVSESLSPVSCHGSLNEVFVLRNKISLQDSRYPCWNRIDDLLPVPVILGGMPKRPCIKLHSGKKAKNMDENKPSFTSNEFKV